MLKEIKMKNKILLSISVLIISLIALSTIAYFISEDKVTNTIETGDVDIEVSENFNEPDDWNGSDYTKEVSITNKSKSSALIRISITPRWEDENGNTYLGDTSFVNLNFNKENILPKGDYAINTDKWIICNDGYYYYNTIVPKDSNTNQILASVQLSKISHELKQLYNNKRLKIDIKAEAVQATKDAHRAAWTTVDSDIQKMLDSLCIR